MAKFSKQDETKLIKSKMLMLNAVSQQLYNNDC